MPPPHALVNRDGSKFKSPPLYSTATPPAGTSVLPLAALMFATPIFESSSSSSTQPSRSTGDAARIANLDPLPHVFGDGIEHDLGDFHLPARHRGRQPHRADHRQPTRTPPHDDRSPRPAQKAPAKQPPTKIADALCQLPKVIASTQSQKKAPRTLPPNQNRESADALASVARPNPPPTPAARIARREVRPRPRHPARLPQPLA